VLPRPGPDGLLPAQLGASRFVVVGVPHVRGDPHGVEEADAGQDRCAAAEQVGFLAEGPAHQFETPPVCRDRADVVVSPSRERTGVKEVELDVVDPERCQRAEVVAQAGRCPRMGDVEAVQGLPPVAATVADEPLRVVVGQPAARADGEGGHPDAGPPPAVPDPPDEVGQGTERLRAVAPVTDSRLPAVVDLDDVDGQVETVHRGEVLLDVTRRHAAEVVVPGAPRRGCLRKRADPGPRRPLVAEGDQGVGDVALHRPRRDRPVRRDDEPTPDELGPDGRDRCAAVRARGRVAGGLPVPAVVDHEDALGLESRCRSRRSGSETHQLLPVLLWPRCGPEHGIGARRAPALPPGLVDPCPLGHDDELVDDLEAPLPV